MAIAGHGARRIIVRHAEGLATFLAVAVPGCWIMLGTIAAGIVAAVTIAALLLLTLRVLAYRLHAKRFADLLVSSLAGLLRALAGRLPFAGGTCRVDGEELAEDRAARALRFRLLSAG